MPQRYPRRQAELGPEVGDHAHDLMLLAAEVEAAVPPPGEAPRLTLPLGEEALQRHLAGGEHAQVAVHREHVLVGLQCGGAADADGLLPDAGEPLGDDALPQLLEHLLLNEAGAEELPEEHLLYGFFGAVLFVGKGGECGGGHFLVM